MSLCRTMQMYKHINSSVCFQVCTSDLCCVHECEYANASSMNRCKNRIDKYLS